MNGKQHKTSEIYQTPHQPRTSKDGATVIMRRPSAGLGLTDFDADEWWNFCATVAGHGDLCSVTLTSDGGALVIAVLQGHHKFKSYARSAAEFVTRITDLLEALY